MIPPDMQNDTLPEVTTAEAKILMDLFHGRFQVTDHKAAILKAMHVRGLLSWIESTSQGWHWGLSQTGRDVALARWKADTRANVAKLAASIA